MTREEDVKEKICSVCHVAVLMPHPEEKLANTGWFKCPICAFCKVIKKKNEYKAS